MLARLLVGAAVAWPLIAGAAVWQRAAAPASTPLFAAVVYAAGGRVCHQRPERSFHTHDVKWPVCARCTGLYLAAPIGALAAFTRRSRTARLKPLRLVVLSAVPTALTLLWEWGGLGTPANLVRFATALPFGAAVAWVLVATVSDDRPSESIR